jgi:hypothetical protein
MPPQQATAVCPMQRIYRRFLVTLKARPLRRSQSLCPALAAVIGPRAAAQIAQRQRNLEVLFVLCSLEAP